VAAGRRVSRFVLGLLAPVLLWGCGEIRLNWAMERLNERYVRLFYDIESGDLLEVRAAARGVQDALADPAIASRRAEPEYARILLETERAAVLIREQAVLKEGGEAKRDTLFALRTRLSQSCQECHELYRR
jgi:hypothetical protein